MDNTRRIAAILSVVITGVVCSSHVGQARIADRAAQHTTDATHRIEMPAAAGAYTMYGMYSRSYQRQLSGTAMGTIFSVGSAVGLLCGVQLAVGVAIAG